MINTSRPLFGVVGRFMRGVFSRNPTERKFQEQEHRKFYDGGRNVKYVVLRHSKHHHANATAKRIRKMQRQARRMQRQHDPYFRAVRAA